MFYKTQKALDRRPFFNEPLAEPQYAGRHLDQKRPFLSEEDSSDHAFLTACVSEGSAMLNCMEHLVVSLAVTLALRKFAGTSR